MAGLYADIPGTRFALDQDGAVMKWRNFTTSSAWTDVTSSLTDVERVNTANYLDIGLGNSNNYAQVAIAFPEARSLAGLYIHLGFSDGGRSASSVIYDYSTDTTDGTDGTWLSLAVTFASWGSHDQAGDSSKPYYRSDIATLAQTNVKGVRVRWNDSVTWAGNHRMYVYHIYGTRPTTGVNRLAFWHPSSDLALTAAYLDFGDIAQGTSVTRQFRIKNLSATQAANTISITVNDLLPEYSSGGVQVSVDNVTYTSPVSIGNLAAGAISSVLYVRRTVPGAETTTQRHARLLANAVSWV